MKRKFRNALILATMIVAAGCATSRGVLDVPQEVSVNPESGEALKFVRVSDNRQFQIDPPEADTPSLKNNEINDLEITSRAIARKRNTFGKALGDILLPEGKTVAGMVETSLTTGFRENGYRVVTEDDPDFADAIPVEVDIEKFWGWFDPGFWEVQLKFSTLIRLSAPAGSFVDGKEFGGDVEKGFQIASGGNWLKTIQASLDDINKDIAAEIAANAEPGLE